MSEHPVFNTPPPPPPRPFDAEPRSTPLGCGTPVLVGCGILFILLFIGAVALVLNAKSLLAYTMTKLQDQVVAALPEGVTEAESDQLRGAFSAAIARIRSGEMDYVQLQAMQSKLVRAAEDAPRGELTVSGVRDLIVALENFAAGPAPAPAAPAEPVPAGPTSTPQPEAVP